MWLVGEAVVTVVAEPPPHHPYYPPTTTTTYWGVKCVEKRSGKSASYRASFARRSSSVQPLAIRITRPGWSTSNADRNTTSVCQS